MTGYVSFVLLPLGSIALTIGLTALRMLRKPSWGLVLLCFATALWVFGLMLLATPETQRWAERLLPSGMLLAGAYVQAAVELTQKRRPGLVTFTWVASLAVAATGWLWPRSLYGAGAQGMGPLFLPVAAVSVAGTLSMMGWLLWLVRSAPPGRERARRWVLLAGNVAGALGGGGVITLHILQLGSVSWAAPLLLVSLAMAAWAVWWSQESRGRALLGWGAASAVLLAVLMVPLVLGLMAWAPFAAQGQTWGTLGGLAVLFWAMLPIEPLRQLITERVLDRLWPVPHSPRALVASLEAHEVRSAHMEQLAEVGRVASAVAHEVRNPMGVILAELKLLERSGADTESVQSIRQQVMRTSQFVDELLRYAKPQPMTFASVEVVSLLRAALAAVAHMHQGVVRVVLAVPPRLEIEADARALDSVFTNLITNAVIATEDSGSPVEVTLLETPFGFECSVKDGGPGVPQELLARLFEPFVTGRGRDSKHPGTGLGLALSARLAHRHGASIEHRRPAEGGAHFIIRWPMVPVVPKEFPT